VGRRVGAPHSTGPARHAHTGRLAQIQQREELICALRQLQDWAAGWAAELDR
jgi:hypothetical protein